MTTTLGPDEAARLFGKKGERFLRHAFRTLTPLDVRGRFEEWDVALEEAPLEKVFPRSGNARDVRDALEAAARSAGARIELGAPVEGIGRDGDRWRVDLEDGMTLGCDALVLAAGGMSYPGTGTTGDGYGWLRDLGLEVVDPVPALVPLTSPEGWVRDLTGIAWQEGRSSSRIERAARSRGWASVAGRCSSRTTDSPAREPWISPITSRAPWARGRWTWSCGSTRSRTSIEKPSGRR